MQRILAAIDGSEHADHAIEQLIRMATSGLAIDVLLLNVQPEIVDWQTHGLAIEPMLAHRQDLARQATERAHRLLDAAGIPHARRIELGDAAATIARVAREAGCDFIAMGTRGTGALSGLVMGSVATKVLHLADAPVMLVK